MHRIVWLPVVLLLALALVACSASTPPTATPVPPAATKAPQATAAPANTAAAQPTAAPTDTKASQPAAVTAGSLAAEGKTIFAGRCASCHGANGEGRTGPALIGSGAALGKYGDAKKLLDFISSAMPKANPGSLKPEEYQRLVAFLLVQDGIVQTDAALDLAKLNAITLK